MVNKACTACGTVFTVPPYREKTANYCSPKCRAIGVGKQKEIDIAARFWAKVIKYAPGKCWQWTGAKTNGGYGVLGSGGKRGKIIRATRLSYALHKGGIPERQVVRHTCDNPECVNPDHLILGTQADNMRDAISRGRRVHPPKKLSDEQVEYIHQNNRAGVRALARELGVSPALICQIRAGKRRIKG